MKLGKKVIELVKKDKTITAILVVAVLLRFIGIYPGYHPYHSDEGMSYSSAIEMIRNLNIDPGRYDYPALIPLINAVIYILLFIPLFLIKSLIFSPGDLPTKGQNIVEIWQQVVIANQQTMVLFWGRFVTAAFGVGVVFLVYKFSAIFFKDKRIGLVAAFLTAVNFRQVLNSHLGLPDIYNAFFLLLAFYFLALLLKNPNRQNYLLSGVASALYFSTKYQPFLFPVFVLVHLYLVWKTKSNFLKKDFLIAALLTPIIFLILNPYHLIHWDEFVAINSYNVFKYGVGIKVLNFYPISYLYHIGIGQFIFISIILGILIGLRKYTFKTLILLSVVFPFMFLLIYYTRGGYYTRNFVTLTPLFLIFAAIFLVWIFDYFARILKLKQNVIGFVLGVVIIFSSWDNLKNSFISSYYFSKPWGYEQAHKWAQINIPEKSKVMSHPWDKYPRDKSLEIIPLEISTVFSLAEMQEENADFGFINMDWLTLGSYWWMNRTTKESLEFWEKPNDLLSNTYSAIVAQELANFTVAKFVKPWQAPDMNFLIVKVPKIPKIGKKHLISSFSFDKKEELAQWSLIDGDYGMAQKITFDPDLGKKMKGSLKVENGIRRLPIVRAVSPALPIAPGKSYVIEGWIKAGSLLEKKARDGVLRVDFYDENPGQIELTTEKLFSQVSSRIFGDTAWIKKEIIVTSPPKSRFITTSFQINGYGDFWFDDIKVYEADILEDPNKADYIDYQIPHDILFPYSQGGL